MEDSHTETYTVILCWDTTGRYLGELDSTFFFIHSVMRRRFFKKRAHKDRFVLYTHTYTCKRIEQSPKQMLFWVKWTFGGQWDTHSVSHLLWTSLCQRDYSILRTTCQDDCVFTFFFFLIPWHVHSSGFSSVSVSISWYYRSEKQNIMLTLFCYSAFLPIPSIESTAIFCENLTLPTYHASLWQAWL